MKLETISLKNFGSFRDATIDLRSVAAAVVMGQNGAGKSTAFIDAPLAALFGKCRTSLDDMISLGADDMSLTVTFEVTGQRYRVIRKRSKRTKAGKSELSLQVAQGEGWADASGARLPETQDKIVALLNADAELLTATGFLVQGSADRFSRATSAERKAILAQILRLDQYGPLKQAANRHLTIADTKHTDKQAELSVHETEAATLESLEARQAEVQGAMGDCQRAIEQLEQDQRTQLEKKAWLTAELAQAAELPGQIQTLETRRASLANSIKALRERRDRAEKILRNRETIESKVKEEAILTTELQQCADVHATCQREIQQATKELEAVQQQLLAGATLQRAVDAAQAKVKELVRACQAETKRLQEEIARDEQQAALLTSVPCDSGLQQRCQFTLSAFKAQSGLPDKRQLVANRWATEDAILEQAHPEELRALSQATAAHADWIAQDWTKQQVSWKECRAQWDDRAVTAKQREGKVKVDLDALAKFTVLVPELAAADREVEQVTQDLDRLDREQAEVDEAIDQLKGRQEALGTLRTSQQNLESSLAQGTVYLTRLRGDSQTATARLKELEIEIKSAKDAAHQAEALQQDCAQLSRDVRHFQALVQAYAQIPILILETSIPLLEEEANRILSKISTSGLRVTINTQKTLKSRDGLAETLDISVRDVFGERLLENFSGGERARVDLAIRIGLSKLLANRAGARLETLIVDEAFAAVDRDGVEQLVECLPLLTQEFSRVLFVTHDEHFKSAVAQQIVVTKNGDGSQVAVVA